MGRAIAGQTLTGFMRAPLFKDGTCAVNGAKTYGTRTVAKEEADTEVEFDPARKSCASVIESGRPPLWYRELDQTVTDRSRIRFAMRIHPLDTRPHYR